ncbi:ParA/MinD ATPase like [Rubrobacter radiotolerans]|uniref:Iron-sulfur cluster carrier protein n=1 Tax=Rubrobacter radiotolerans TaxID=42256 RepID=A0A023X2I1_RUBRA|nr:ParA/MinD ATPase like [Rubrobacter radiotolerans]SMC04843.1 ATP-binding protein involved in chromosome partitioning [Rubrobacter radiotolerans DSM 5868]
MANWFRGRNGRQDDGAASRAPVVDEASVRTALRDVRDPELGRDLISLNMIRDVRIDGASVAVTVALTTAGCPMKHRISGDITDRLKMLEGVEDVAVDFGEMTAQDRQNLMVSLHGEATELAPAFTEESKTRVIAVVSGKGGVGKSTVAVNLAAALERAGKSVEILDADVYGSSIPVMLGALEKPNVVEGVIFPIESPTGLKFISMGNFVSEGQAIIWRAPIVNKALTQLMRDVYWDEPDFIVVDMPPGTGDVALTVAQMIPKAEALVVTTPQADAARVAAKAGKMAVQAHLKVIGVVENMAYAECPDCGKELRIFGGNGGESVATELASKILGRIPIQPDASGEPGNALYEEGSAPARAFDEVAASIAAVKVRKKLRVL